jgi:hypothetical protein
MLLLMFQPKVISPDQIVLEQLQVLALTSTKQRLWDCLEHKAGMLALDKLLYPDLDWPKMDTAFTTEAPMTRPCGAKNFGLIKNLEHWYL